MKLISNIFRGMMVYYQTPFFAFYRIPMALCGSERKMAYAGMMGIHFLISFILQQIVQHVVEGEEEEHVQRTHCVESQVFLHHHADGIVGVRQAGFGLPHPIPHSIANTDHYSTIAQPH